MSPGKANRLVSVERLSFVYEGDVAALRDVSFALDKGEFLVVMGANGAGKSTLCYILSGIIPGIFTGRRTGAVTVASTDPWEQKMFQMAERCAVVLQDPETQLFMPNLMLELAFGPANLGVPRDEILSRVAENLALVGLDGLEKRSPKALSGGQKQRAALASALTMNSDILILDEPTSQMDPLGSDEILASIRRIRQERDVGIIMTTHKTEEILDLADTVMVLQEGSVLALGPRDEVLGRVGLLEAAGVQPPPAQKLFSLLEGKGLTFPCRPLDTAGAARVIRRQVETGSITVGQPAPPPAVQAIPGAEPVLSIQNLTVTYPGPPPVTAVRNVNLDIAPGEFVGIIGQNGSGKSTLVKAVVRLLEPASGQILFRGEPTGGFSVGRMATRIGLVLQNPDYQLFSVSALEEAAFGPTNLNASPAEARAAAREALAMVGLDDQADVFPFRMSFGDRRKLAVAAVMAMGPEILILDEPTTAQDYRGRYLLADLAEKLRREQGRTIIMITHDMDLVAACAHRLVVLYNGQVLLDGPTPEVFARVEELARTYLKPPATAAVWQELAGAPGPAPMTTDRLADLLVPGDREGGVGNNADRL